jgi:hemerythrin superfamily protein
MNKAKVYPLSTTKVNCLFVTCIQNKRTKKAKVYPLSTTKVNCLFVTCIQNNRTKKAKVFPLSTTKVNCLFVTCIQNNRTKKAKVYPLSTTKVNRLFVTCIQNKRKKKFQPIFFFFFDNSKQTSFVGNRTPDVSHGRRQEVPLGHKGLDTLCYICYQPSKKKFNKN